MMPRSRLPDRQVWIYRDRDSILKMAHIQSRLDCISETIMLYLVWRNQIEKDEGPYVYVDISEWLQWFNIEQKNHSAKLIQLLRSRSNGRKLKPLCFRAASCFECISSLYLFHILFPLKEMLKRRKSDKYTCQ